MDAASLAFSVAQTLLTALQLPELEEIISICGYESRLKKLQGTVTRINAVLQDAEAQEELSQQQLDYVGKLKDAVYDADDLLDEFITRKQQQQIPDSSKGQFSRLVSPFKKLSLACKMSQEIKKIREKLDGIADDAAMFDFKCDYKQPVRRERKQTCSYVYAESVIGREDDKIKIVDMLLDANVEGALPVISIVGIGGLGKTTLARLVFNDKRIEKEFPKRLWVCVADQDQHQWNVNTILANILRATNKKDVDKDGIEQVVQKLRENLHRSKYLLVLDDMWTEDHSKWLELKDYLLGLGQRGSKIVVTTRSEKTARAVGSNNMHKLQGLSEEDSWHLFESIVGSGQAIHDDLVDIGKDILKNCANVPLAIKVVGSLLYGEEDKSKWESFQHRTLNEIRKAENGVMPILKLSYHNLSPPLKSCFSYCAVFPKDFVIEKDMLIRLWMAQGYLGALDEDQSMEVVGEEYFQILLQRCFFQDIKKDTYGEILSCKMHDLMHDVAQEVAGKEIVVANSTTRSPDPQVQIRHIHFQDDPSDYANRFISKAQIRTYLQDDGSWRFQLHLSMHLKKWINLRALHLAGTNLESLPNDIGKLLHLRYLDLSQSHLRMLPKSITKLVNLQTLHLNALYGLEELPRDLNRLVKLRVLGIAGCRSLKYMPENMNRMTCLNTLPMFVVAKRDSSTKQGLEDLRALSKLKGNLKIRINEKFVYKKERNSRGGGYISNMKDLNHIGIKWFADDEDENENENESENEEGGIENAEERWGIKNNVTTCLANLVPNLKICINEKFVYKKERNSRGGGYISNTKDLNHIGIKWPRDEEDENESENEEGGIENAEDLLEDLQPNPNLKGLRIRNYRGTKIPWQGIENNLATFLPKLVNICISKCDGLQSLPWLGKLQFLKSLEVRYSSKLQYMEDRIFSWNDSSTGSYGAAREVIQQESSPFFPSLESLCLSELPELQGWWRGFSTSGSVTEDDEMMGGESSVQTVGADRLPSFPRLSELQIYACRNLTVIPLCPTVETLTLEGFNERLQIMTKKEEDQREECGSSDSGRSSHDGPKIRVVRTTNARHLKSLPPVAFQCLAELTISWDSKVESLSEIEVVFRSCSSSLRTLNITGCPKLRSVSGVLEYLTALESLELPFLEELRFDETDGEGEGEEEERTDMTWRRLGHCLRSLTLPHLPNVDDLPKWMSYLTALQSFHIRELYLDDLDKYAELKSLLIRN